jgi:hypothetical protein
VSYFYFNILYFEASGIIVCDCGSRICDPGFRICDPGSLIAIEPLESICEILKNEFVISVPCVKNGTESWIVNSGFGSVTLLILLNFV